MKNILLVGRFTPSHNNQYLYPQSFKAALETIGFNVETFDCYKNRVPNFLLHLPIISIIAQKISNYYINRALIKKVRQHSFNYVFFIKAENITAQTLKKIRPTKLINFYPDNPFTTWNGNSTQNFIGALTNFDHFLIWSHTLIPKLQGAGCKQTYYFPFCFDEKLFAQPAPKEISQPIDICFIGTWEPAREEWLSYLCTHRPELNIKILGNRWHKNCTSPQVKKFVSGSAVYGQNMIKLLQSSKIVLNFIRAQNKTAHNMRSIEAPAAQTFLLTQRTKEQAEELFTEGEHLACFETPEELLKQVDFYLERPKKRHIIASNARAHAHKHYTLSKQLDTFFSSLER